MESGFTSDTYEFTDSRWQRIPHRGSGRFEFFRVRSEGNLYFVKRPSAAFRHGMVTVESLKKEFYLGSRLDHPSLPKYVKMEDGALYEEFIDGISIREMIDNKDSRIKSRVFVANMCRDLLRATEYLHNNGIIHNDIKPENVMITRIGEQLKLIDLGCASTDRWDHTEGYTPEYKAPEQGVAPTGIQTDIYLVGKLMEEVAVAAGDAAKWHDFVKRSTINNPKFRFSSDKSAMNAIPYHGIKSTLGCLLFAFLIIIGMIAVESFGYRWIIKPIIKFFGWDTFE